MATIRHSLQKEVFDVSAERLIGILHVTKPGKKKNRKTSFLCAVINKEKPVYAYIHQVKETEKDSFKKKCSWPLLELQTVHGKDANKETPEFDLQIDRVYKWIASSVPEKHSFIQVLWKLCCLYLPKQKPQFINIPSNLIKEDITQAEVIITPGEFSSTQDETKISKLISTTNNSPKQKKMLPTNVESAINGEITHESVNALPITTKMCSLSFLNVHSRMLGAEDDRILKDKNSKHHCLFLLIDNTTASILLSNLDILCIKFNFNRSIYLYDDLGFVIVQISTKAGNALQNIYNSNLFLQSFDSYFKHSKIFKELPYLSSFTFNNELKEFKSYFYSKSYILNMLSNILSSVPTIRYNCSLNMPFKNKVWWPSNSLLNLSESLVKKKCTYFEDVNEFFDVEKDFLYEFECEAKLALYEYEWDVDIEELKEIITEENGFWDDDDYDEEFDVMKEWEAEGYEAITEGLNDGLDEEYLELLILENEWEWERFFYHQSVEAFLTEEDWSPYLTHSQNYAELFEEEFGADFEFGPDCPAGEEEEFVDGDDLEYFLGDFENEEDFLGINSGRRNG